MSTLIRFLLPVFLLTAGAAYPQERKKITDRSGTKYVKDVETYYVLKAEPGTKDGPYQKTRNGKLIISGFYDHGQKDSLWEMYAYSVSGQLPISKKRYMKGKPGGKWEFYDQKGMPNCPVVWSRRMAQLSQLQPPVS